jgi:ATP-dependent Clp protease protease subunit
VTEQPFTGVLDAIRAAGGEQLQQNVIEQTSQRLLRQRIIFIADEVNDAMATRVVGDLLLLSAEDRERDISLYVNSPGGSVSAGMAIYDIMQYIPNDVATVGMGMAASMGQVLLCAGTPGKRYALPHARVMMHQPSSGVGGTATDIRIRADDLVYVKNALLGIIAHHTGQSLEQVEKDADRDRWFNAEQAKEYGFVDEVVGSLRQVNAS